jgi:TrmH family RNA methyltransferase
MTRLRPVTSRHNELVARFKAAARGDEAGLLLLDGAHLIADAVAARLELRHVMVSSEAAQDDGLRPLLEQMWRDQVDVIEASAPVMSAVSPVRTPSHVVAVAVRPLRRSLFAAEPAMVVIACDVQDPGNLGAIARAAEAAGASGLFAAGQSADPFGWKALRGSMGSALRLPIAVERHAATAIEDARRHGCRIVATVPRDGESLFEADLTGPIALLIGGEGAGLDDHVVRTADHRITIPMQAPVESLNAAVAGAVVLYEALRQRVRIRNSEFRIRSRLQ